MSIYAGNALAAPTRQWSHGDPSGEEQYVLEILNRVRRDPAAAMEDFIAASGSNATLKAIIGNLTNRDAQNNPLSGAPAARLLVQQRLEEYLQNSAADPTRTPPPRAPLAFYPAFSAIAQSRLTTDESRLASGFSSGPRLVNSPTDSSAKPAILGPNATGGIATTRPGGLNSTGEFTFGEKNFILGLTADTSMREAFVRTLGVVAFETYLLDSLTSTRVGSGPGFTLTRGTTRMVGMASKATGISDLTRAIGVYRTDNEVFANSDLPFGAEGTVFIVGVVYEDKNKDGEFTAGEGIAGVRVTPDNGDWYAVTSSSGGYAFPVSKNTGAVTVTFKGGAIDASAPVIVGGDNVKLDNVHVDTTKPSQILVPASDGTTKFSNLSTRGIAEAGSTALIGGFVISGTGQKQVLLRGVGHTLTRFGLSGILRRPMITLFDARGAVIKSATVLDTYENLRFANGPTPVTETYSRPESGDKIQVKASLTSVFRQVGAFDYELPLWATTDTFFVTNRDLYSQGDVAMVVSLSPGLYSVGITPDPLTTLVAVSSSDGTRLPEIDLHQNPALEAALFPGFQFTAWGDSGVALLEIYDVGDVNGSSRFVNLSTRGKIETGPRQMIVGLTVAGTGHRRMLVRGIGPSLRALGVGFAIEDVATTLFDSAGHPLANNDDWGMASWTDQSATLGQSVGAFAISEAARDSIILYRLGPGNYSAGLTLINSTTGVGLAEIYETP